MQVMLKTDDKDVLYELTYNKEELEKLIAEIIEKCSIRVYGRCLIKAKSCDDAANKIRNSRDFVGNFVYENVSDLRQETFHKPWEYEKYGEPETFSFNASELVTPSLVGFLLELMEGKTCGFESFATRREITRKSDLQRKMEELDFEINFISNYDAKNKIAKINELAQLYELYTHIPDFDLQLLASYYEKAENIIRLDSIQETTFYKKVLTPNQQKN